MQRKKKMHFPTLHSWDLSSREAVTLQRELAGRVEVRDRLAERVRLVAGVDVSSARFGTAVHAAVVVYDLDRSVLVATAAASMAAAFPYVPGLLSFRELPVVLEAFRGLAAIPDMVLVDGQGIAHPRRLGIASHLGLWLDLPSVGCAKSRLCGEHGEPGALRGAWARLTDGEEEIGRVVRTRDRVRPLFVSPGHRVGMVQAVQIVLACGRGYRLPEPTRLAHIESNMLRVRQV
jgi:deoxyribonuclease V